MTTVVADQKRKIIAADTLITTFNDVPPYHTSKLFRVGASIFGFSGDVPACMKFKQWQLEWGGVQNKRPKYKDTEDFSILEITVDGMFQWDPMLSREKIEDELHATGTGSSVALYCARVLGYSAERSVFEAAKIDKHTGHPVKLMSLDSLEAITVEVTW